MRVNTATEAYGSRENCSAAGTSPVSSRPLALAGAASRTPSAVITSGAGAGPTVSR